MPADTPTADEMTAAIVSGDPALLADLRARLVAAREPEEPMHHRLWKLAGRAYGLGSYGPEYPSGSRDHRVVTGFRTLADGIDFARLIDAARAAGGVVPPDKGLAKLRALLMRLSVDRDEEGWVCFGGAEEYRADFEAMLCRIREEREP